MGGHRWVEVGEDVEEEEHQGRLERTRIVKVLGVEKEGGSGDRRLSLGLKLKLKKTRSKNIMKKRE